MGALQKTLQMALQVDLFLKVGFFGKITLVV